MDCHASTTALARNDDKNGVSKKVDSRDNAQNVENSAKDSKENAKILNTPQNEKVESVFDSDSQAAGFCVFYPNAASKKVDSSSGDLLLRDTAEAVARQSTLESSSRDFRKEVVAIHKSAQVDSTFLPFALDSSSTRISSLKGGQGGYLRSVPPYPPLLHSFCPQSPCTLSK